MLTDPTKQNWRMPIARTQSGGNHGAFQLFPDQPIYLDFDAAAGGDGSAENPINSFEVLFADDDLECTCRALCCNKITVKIKGTYKNSGELSELAVNGRGRDYYGNLVIEPWEAACVLNGLTTIVASEDTLVESDVSFFENLFGVIFRNLSFRWMVSGEKPAEAEERSGLGLIGELNGFKGCSYLQFINCDFSQVVRVNFAAGNYDWPPADNEIQAGVLIDRPQGWLIQNNYSFQIPSGGGGGGGWGGGSYRRAGGSAGDGGIGGGFTNSVDENCKVFFTAANFRGCTGIWLSDCQMKVDIDLRSNAGARGWAFNLLACQICDIDDTSATATAQTYDARSGVVKNGEILPYSLVADSIVSGLANCNNSSVAQSKFTTTAGATATPLTLLTSGNVGGQSKAESYAILRGDNFAAENSRLISAARASHPSRWAYMANPAFETVIDETSNAISDSYRRDSEGR